VPTAAAGRVGAYARDMDAYRPPLADIRFSLEHEVPLARLTAEPALAVADLDTVTGLLEEAGRFAAEVVAPTNRVGDREGARLADGRVLMPAEFRAAYARYVEAGWGAVQHPEEYGGGGFPLLVATAVKELITSANMAFSLGPLLTTGAVHLLTHHGSSDQRARWLPRMVTGEWTGTMNLTEPQAGSDLGAVTTRAEPGADGGHRIFGQKIYITYGDHDLAEQVVHLVLARLPDAPPGVKGISLFIVPKRLVGPDGELGAENDVRVVSIEHKLGIHGSPTCVMAFGEGGDGAWAELVGAPHDGMRQMFTMMNDARLGVGLQGLAIAERALQQAEAYARDRQQGRAVGAPPGAQSPIVAHPDVRRTLLEARAQIDAMRALCYANAHALDLAQHASDPDERARQARLADLLTPLSKAWSTDLGVELTSDALQVHGGMGYVEETGVAQHLRDARIAPIYEGTNGIQAIDLVGRKLPMEEGRLVARVLDDLVADLDGAPAAVADLVPPVIEAAALARDLAVELLAMRDDPRDALAGATPYLRILATAVGAALVVRGVVSAERVRAAGGKVDAVLLAQRTARARVLVRRVLPRVHGLAPVVRAGAGDLYAEGTPAA
jgi:alkylation response protein AidB-like acyl-CoA dehydrogenase